MTSVQIDHIVMCVTDLGVAAEGLAERTGLAARAGGRHPDHGTANVIVPFGNAYLELVSVIDQDAAAASPWGLWVGEHAQRRPRVSGWCLRVDDIESVAHRIGESTVAMARERPDGLLLRWTLTGLGGALSALARPFFIEWHVAPALLPGSLSPDSTSVTIDWLEVGADDADELDTWIGPHALPLRLVEGASNLRRVGISTSGGSEIL
jgi:hypothetical protein